MNRLTAEEIYLMVNNDKLVKEYDLLNMYSVCQKINVEEKERKCDVCNETKAIEDFKRNVSSNYIYNKCLKCYNKSTYQTYKNKNKKQ
jgi:hypothetical protein